MNDDGDNSCGTAGAQVSVTMPTTQAAVLTP